jgi:hypothetical protein
MTGITSERNYVTPKITRSVIGLIACNCNYLLDGFENMSFD